MIEDFEKELEKRAPEETKAAKEKLGEKQWKELILDVADILREMNKEEQNERSESN